MSAPPLSLVIPAFNEAGHIAPTLAETSAFLHKHFPGAELIVVDDGSTDDTPRILEAAAGPDLKTIRLPRNSGKGAAVRAGLEAASGNICAFTDADLSTPLSMLHPALTLLESGTDLVLGTRAASESQVIRPQRFIRRHMGGGFNIFVRAFTGLPYADTQCGFKVFRQDALARILPLARENGFAFDVELLLIARHLGLRCEELPVEWHNRPETHVHMLRHPAQMILALLPMAWRWRRKA